MQAKNDAILFLLISKSYLFLHYHFFIWHNHCSGNQALRVKGVNILLIRLECPKPCTFPKRPLTQV